MQSRKGVLTLMTTPAYNGLLVIDKPGGMTSRAVVNRGQGWFPRGTRIGHAGTLDPLATGVLVLCVGTATRLTEYVQRMEKTYRAGLLLGSRSDTDDADGMIEAVEVPRPPDWTTVARHLQGFVGRIEQVPPDHSAAKVSGRRAYDLARTGQKVSLEPRPAQVYGIDILSYDYPLLDLEVRCGKGTYIRSLARDLGEQLDCGALVKTLRRTQTGPFRERDAIPVDLDSTAAISHLLPLASALVELPRITLQADEIARLRQGQRIPFVDTASSVSTPNETSPIELAAYSEVDELVAVVRLDSQNHLLSPTKVFNV